MARNLEQTLKDLKQLEAVTADLDTRLQGLYGQYFDQLGQGARRQLVLAAYHLCTEVYPEAFLTLSVGQREKLQRELRQIAAQGRSHIQSLTQMDTVSATLRLLLQSTVPDFALAAGEGGAPTEDTPGDGAESGAAEPGATEPGSAEPAMELNGEEQGPGLGEEALDPGSSPGAMAESTPGPLPEPSPDLGEPESAPAPTPSENWPSTKGSTPAPWRDLLRNRSLPPEALAALSDVLTPPEATAPSPLTLARRHMLLERQVRAILHSLSTLANRALQQANILPDLPEEVLAAAMATADREEGGTTKQPNLVSVLVSVGPEMESETGSEEPEPGDFPRDPRDSPSREVSSASSSESETNPGDSGDEAEYRPDVTPLVAISLRLGEIEFAEPQLTLRRDKLREALARLRNLSRRYRKLQREKAQAEAAAAWRSTWFDED